MHRLGKLISLVLTMGRKVRTLQLEQHALTSRDLCTGLAHPLDRQRDLLLVAARYAVREDVHVIAVLQKIKGGLQHADMRLRRLIRLMVLTRSTTHLDAHKDERLEFVFLEQGEDLRCRH